MRSPGEWLNIPLVHEYRGLHRPLLPFFLFCLPLLFSHLSVTLRTECVLVLLLLSAPAPFKYHGELRLGRRAPPSPGLTGAQSRGPPAASQWARRRNTPVSEGSQWEARRAAGGDGRLLPWHGVFVVGELKEFST